MAKPNYQFEKRRREMAKKAKKEEKKLRKLASDGNAESKDSENASGEDSPPAASGNP